MRWFFILLLVVNLIYFGWELDRQTRIDLNQARDTLAIPPSASRLVLIKELPAPPGARNRQPDAGPGEDVTGDEFPAENETSPDPAPADVKIGEAFTQELVSQLPDISIPGLPDKTLPGQPMCFSYGPFPDHQQALELMAWFETRQVPVQQRLESGKENQLFWIYLKPQGSRDHAMQAIEDLKSKGVTDYRLIETGDLLNAISLGLFSTQASVNKRLNELKNKGYQPVVVPYRNAEAITWLDVRLVDQPEVLNEMFREDPARYNSIPVTCGEIALQ